MAMTGVSMPKSIMWPATATRVMGRYGMALRVSRHVAGLTGMSPKSAFIPYSAGSTGLPGALSGPWCMV